MLSLLGKEPLGHCDSDFYVGFSWYGMLTILTVIESMRHTVSVVSRPGLIKACFA